MKVPQSALVMAAAVSLLGETAANLFIQSPKRLIEMFKGEEGKKGLLRANFANFGLIPYGHSMIGKVYYSTEYGDLCDPLPDGFLDTITGRGDYQNDEEVSFNDILGVPFMIANRGGCSFVQKVRNMEDAGFALGIVVDDSEENIDEIIMSDDGTGAGLRIPSLLVSKRDGLKLIDFIETASSEELSQMIMIADFNIQRPDNRVEYDFWYTSSDQLSLDFIQDFSKLDRRLGDSVLMTPRFVFWECIDCDPEYVAKHCYGGGKYCAIDQSQSLPGKDIVMEDLRQMCVYQQAYGPEESWKRKMYWDYMKTVHQECDNQIDEMCSELGHKEVKGLDWAATQRCVKESFSSPDQERWNEVGVNNTLIDRDVEYWWKYGTAIYPSIIINNNTYRGQLETQAVFNALCAGFRDPPKPCQ
mmetsp:Transcript_13087/g.22086  ORF Transcript_13087/g.22086 Transcript_13087/m.22086 type:complete len:415 (+) Transcript_13087:46-1290(+)